MLTAIIFLLVSLICYILCLVKEPFWGLVAYANVYFNTPSVDVNWWAEFLPDFRWSLLSACVLLASIIIHRDKLSQHKLGFIYFLVILLYLLIVIQSFTYAVSPDQAKYYADMMLGYCIIIFLMVKILARFERLRMFILVIIGLSAFLGIQALLQGEFVDGRLDNIGPGDANSSNEFGLLLSAVIPFLIPFIVKGSLAERIICFLSIPFIINGFTLTVSRGALVALIVGIIYVYIFISDKKIKKIISIALLCLVFAFSFFIDDSYKARISTLWMNDRSNSSALDTLSSGRTAIWRHSLNMVNDYPFGTGPGGFREISRFYMPEKMLSYHPGLDYGVRAAHNTYLLVLVELGYPGILIFLTLCGLIMYYLFKSIKFMKQRGKSGTFVGLLTISMNMSFVATLAGGLFGSSYYYEFFWWQIGIAIVLISFVSKYDQDSITEKTYSSAHKMHQPSLNFRLNNK